MFANLNLNLFPGKQFNFKKFEFDALKSSLLSMSTMLLIFRLLAKSKAVIPRLFLEEVSAPFKIIFFISFDFSIFNQKLYLLNKSK